MQKVVSHYRGVSRLLRLAFHVSKGLTKLYWLNLSKGSSWHKTTAGLDTITLWMQQLTTIFNVKITRHGHPARPAGLDGGTLYLSNHVSWLDIIIISSLTHVKFVSKDDLISWPFVGRLSKDSGTLFLDRNNKFALRDMLKQIQRRLENRLNVLIFPEGTTTDGETVSEFRNALIQAAINSASHIQTITLHYHKNGELCQTAPYINDDKFFPHAYRLLCQKYTEVNVQFDSAETSENKTRQDISHQSRQVMLDTLEQSKVLTARNHRVQQGLIDSAEETVTQES